MYLFNKKNIFYIIIFYLFSFRSQAAMTCSDIFNDLKFSVKSSDVSASSELLIQTRFEKLQQSEVQNLGAVDLRSGGFNSLEKALGEGGLSVAVIERLDFDDTALLRGFLENLYSDIQSPGLIIVESLPEHLGEAFSVILKKIEGSVGKSLSHYFKPAEDQTIEVIIDVLNLKDLYLFPASAALTKKTSVKQAASAIVEVGGGKSVGFSKLGGEIKTKTIEWATLRVAVSSDQRVLDFLVKYANDTVLDNQKLVIESVTKSNADRIAEVMRASFSRSINKTNVSKRSRVEIEIVDIETGANNTARSDFDEEAQNTEVRKVLFSVIVTKRAD